MRKVRSSQPCLHAVSLGSISVLSRLLKCVRWGDATEKLPLGTGPCTPPASRLASYQQKILAHPTGDNIKSYPMPCVQGPPYRACAKYCVCDNRNVKCLVLGHLLRFAYCRSVTAPRPRGIGFHAHACSPAKVWLDQAASHSGVAHAEPMPGVRSTLGLQSICRMAVCVQTTTPVAVSRLP